MAHGELASARDVYPDFARYRVIRLQGPCGHFCTLDGYRGNLWAYGGYYCEGNVQVRCTPLFREKRCAEYSKGIPYVRYLRRLPARHPMHNTRDLRISRRSCCSEVGCRQCLFSLSSFIHRASRAVALCE